MNSFDPLVIINFSQDLPPLPVPRYYMVNLTSSDGSDLIITRNVTVIRKQDQIALWLNEGIPPRILWDASVSAYGCQEHMVEGIMLSKLKGHLDCCLPWHLHSTIMYVVYNIPSISCRYS